MARFRATPSGNIPLTSEQEAARDAEEAAWAARIIPTKADIAESRVINDDVLAGIVRYLADQRGVTEDQVRAEIKALI